MFPLINLIPVMHLTLYMSVCVHIFACMCMERKTLVGIWMYTYNYTYIFFSAWTKSFEELNVITRLLNKLRKYFTLTLKEKLFMYFWLHWVFVAPQALSPVAESGTILYLQCIGFSLQWLLLLWNAGSWCRLP